MKIRKEKRGWERLWREIRYWLASTSLRGFVQLLSVLPFKRALMSIMGSIGTKIGWQWAEKYKKKMLDNLAFTFHDSLSEKDKEGIAQESFRNMIRGFVETLFCVYSYRKHFDPIIELEGRKNLEQALAPGRGAIGVTAHFSTFTLIGAKLNANGFHNTWIMGGQNHPRIAQAWRWMTEKAGSGAIIIDSPISFHRAILRVLRKGEIVIFICDENQKRGGVLVDFLGRVMALPVGPAVYHLKTGAPILPIFIIRQKAGGHKVVVEPPLEVKLSGVEERDVFSIVKEISRVIESYIRTYPGQWSWIGKRRIRTQTRRKTFRGGGASPLS